MDYNYIFINGCFDVIHPGHIEFLRFCEKMKELYAPSKLVVALDSDLKIQRDKGDNRPIFSYLDRKFALKRLISVDIFHEFDSNTKLMEWIQHYRPILIKGENWRGKVIGHIYARRIIYFPVDEEYSSTKIIERILEKHENISSG